MLLVAERWLPPFARPLVPLGIVGPVAWSLAVALNVPARWTGRHSELAVNVAASLAIGSLVWLLLILQYFDTGHGVALRSWRPWRRRALVAVLLVAAAALVWFDARHFIGLYPRAHDMLRISSTVCAVLALVAWGEGQARRPNPWPWAALAVGCLGIVAAVWFDPTSVRGTVAAKGRFVATFTGLARRAVNVDHDGHTGLWGGGERDDQNFGENRIPRIVPQRRPFAETPFNRRISAVVLVTVDSLRMDHLGCYAASSLPRTPVLDALARRSVVFDRAYAQGGFTSVSLCALLRGVPARLIRWSPYYLLDGSVLKTPAELAAMHRAGKQPKILATGGRPELDTHPTLASVFGGNGYHTAAILNGDLANFSLMLGSRHGFKHFVDVGALPQVEGREHWDNLAIELAIRELKQFGDERFFLWLHLFGPHHLLQVHAQTPGSVGNDTEARYANAVAAVDLLMGRWLAALEATGMTNVALVFAGDHGERLRPEQAHGMDTTEELIRVPLLISGPGIVARHVDAVVSLGDLAPTLLAWAGLGVPSEMEGGDLRPILWGGAGPGDRAVIVDTWLHDGTGNPSWDLVAIVTQHRKLRWDRVNRTIEITDPIADPFGDHDLRGTEDSAYLQGLLSQYAKRSIPVDYRR